MPYARDAKERRMDPASLLLSPQSPTGQREALPRAQAPLSFTQLSHWHLGGLAERPADRQIVSATQLQGPLESEALQRSLDESVRRHQALRTRIVLSEGGPLQEVLESCRCEIEYATHPAVPHSHRHDLICLEIERFVSQPVDISQAPLYGVRVLRLSADEHVLIIAMEHSISDASSLRFLQLYLWGAGARRRAGRGGAGPPGGGRGPGGAARRGGAH